MGDATGTLVCTSVLGGTLERVWPESGRRVTIADTSGGANGAALAADGGFLVTQNGGIDFSVFEIFGKVPPPRFVRSGIQRVTPAGTVSYLTSAAMHQPNDLCIGADGTVVEVLQSPGDHPVSTNLCFGGDDLRTLFAVDAGTPGHVYCWTGMPAPGRPLHLWGV
jgi:sugar lactone lactonase YvrE